MRITGDTTWLSKKEWTHFCDYEDGLNEVIGNQRLAVLCTYPLAACGAPQILLFFDGWIASVLGKMSMDRRQVETLRTVSRVTVQIVAVLFILLVLFGPPTQLGTFLGLAAAGLTVVLKDFIVGFLGWFVLMGKNGIRLQD